MWVKVGSKVRVRGSNAMVAREKAMSGVRVRNRVRVSRVRVK
jgi:hypothetical protein